MATSVISLPGDVILTIGEFHPSLSLLERHAKALLATLELERRGAGCANGTRAERDSGQNQQRQDRNSRQHGCSTEVGQARLNSEYTQERLPYRFRIGLTPMVGAVGLVARTLSRQGAVRPALTYLHLGRGRVAARAAGVRPSASRVRHETDFLRASPVPAGLRKDSDPLNI